MEYYKSNIPASTGQFDLPLYSQEDIQSRIFTVRGVQVMLDLHLAQLYQVENRVLKQAVRRNDNRFPDDFMFRLTKDEANELISIGVSQSVIDTEHLT